MQVCNQPHSSRWQRHNNQWPLQVQLRILFENCPNTKYLSSSLLEWYKRPEWEQPLPICSFECWWKPLCAVLLDYKKNGIVRTYPLIPGGEPSNYPNSGSSVSLFLKPPYTKAESAWLWWFSSWFLCTNKKRPLQQKNQL
jgi:hypothetical protein